MLSDQYRRELAQIAKDIGKVHTDISKEEENARKARTAMAQKQSSAQRASSVSTRDSYHRQADSEHKKVEAAEKKIGAHRDKLSGLLSRQNNKEQSLRSAERNEQAARDKAAEARKRKEKAEQTTRDREAAKRRQIEKDHAREMSRLSSPTVHHIYIREPEPEKLRVLYLTASPRTPNLPGLRVDTEVNNVLKALRGAGRKDIVDLLQRPAASIEDMVHGLNDHRPHVVHFSGHAENGLLFDTADPLEVGDQLVGYDTVARVLAATDQPPTLLVLNACRTVEGVERLKEVAAVVVATNDTVTDASSAIFATHFYGAIAAGQSIGHAVEQARAMIALALPDDPNVLTINAADGIDPDKLTLVKSIAGEG